MDLMDLRICGPSSLGPSSLGPSSLSLTAVVHCAANAVSVSYRFDAMPRGAGHVLRRVKL